MLVTTTDMLHRAHKKGYAVPSANFIDSDMASTFVALAEQENEPLILSFAESHMEHLSLYEAAYIGIYLAKEAKVGVLYIWITVLMKASSLMPSLWVLLLMNRWSLGKCYCSVKRSYHPISLPWD